MMGVLSHVGLFRAGDGGLEEVFGGFVAEVDLLAVGGGFEGAGLGLEADAALADVDGDELAGADHGDGGDFAGGDEGANLHIHGGLLVDDLGFGEQLIVI